jgi:hypothetical protein
MTSPSEGSETKVATPAFTLKFFSLEEFDDPTMVGSGAKFMDREFLTVLDQIREACGFAFNITSGYRSVDHNADVGGKKNSEHIQGKAVDIFCISSFRRKRIIEVALAHKIPRIGVKKDCIHLGWSQTLPEGVWTYD